MRRYPRQERTEHRIGNDLPPASGTIVPMPRRLNRRAPRHATDRADTERDP